MKFVTATAMFLAMTATSFAATLTEKECNRLPLNQRFEFVAKGLCDFDLNNNGFFGDASVKSKGDKNPDNDNDDGDDGDGDTDTDTDTDNGKGNNGHGNDPDHNDDSNPGKSNDPSDNTDADGTPGNGKNK